MSQNWCKGLQDIINECSNDSGDDELYNKLSTACNGEEIIEVIQNRYNVKTNLKEFLVEKSHK